MPPRLERVGPTVPGLHAAFVASPKHYENLVKPDFRYVGIGVVVDPVGTIFVAEEFMTLQPSTSSVAPAPPAANASSPPPSSSSVATGSGGGPAMEPPPPGASEASATPGGDRSPIAGAETALPDTASGHLEVVLRRRLRALDA